MKRELWNQITATFIYELSDKILDFSEAHRNRI